MGHGRLYTRPHSSIMKSFILPLSLCRQWLCKCLQELWELLPLGQAQLVLIRHSKQGTPSCFSQFLGVLETNCYGAGMAPAQSSQITLSKGEAFALVGGLVGYILSLQNTVPLQSLGLCPHLKYIYPQMTGFKGDIVMHGRVSQCL